MKAYVKSDIQAMSIQRIVSALAVESPDAITIVDTPDDADVIVHIVVGVQNFSKEAIDVLVAKELARGQHYAILQCCVNSTESPVPSFWGPLWEKAAVVWSYLDLRKFAPAHEFNFYYAPLGVDRQVFNRSKHRFRDITLLTTGHVAESEGVIECAEAVRRMGGFHVHLGPDFKLGPHVMTVRGISDERLASLYARSTFVAGLRRCEGFELPAAEGLLCGARPIMFDRPHYRQWFDPWAVYVPETDPPAVTDAIERVLKSPTLYEAGPTRLDSELAAVRFDWSMVVGDFWRHVIQACEGRTERLPALGSVPAVMS